MKWVSAWIATALAFAGLDVIWLSQVSPRLDPPIIGELLSHRVEIAPAVIFYVLYITGIVWLAVRPAQRGAGWVEAIINGAFLGLVAYGTYDLTNQATLKVWSTTLTLADLAWGTFATACGALSGYVFGKRRAPAQQPRDARLAN